MRTYVVWLQMCLFFFFKKKKVILYLGEKEAHQFTDMVFWIFLFLVMSYQILISPVDIIKRTLVAIILRVYLLLRSSPSQ